MNKKCFNFYQIKKLEIWILMYCCELHIIKNTLSLCNPYFCSMQKSNVTHQRSLLLIQSWNWCQCWVFRNIRFYFKCKNNVQNIWYFEFYHQEFGLFQNTVLCVSTRMSVHRLIRWSYEKYFIVTPMWMAIRKIYSLSDMSRSTQIISFLACRYEVVL